MWFGVTAWERHTDLIKLNDVELGSGIAEELLRGAAVRAVALAEDGDGVLVDDGLNLLLCGGHGAWADGAPEDFV